MRVTPQSVRKIHFIGIGGIGMSGIAEVLHNLGYKVSGSDISNNANVKRLRALGIVIFNHHEASNCDDAQVVVISSDIKSNNIELCAARNQGLPIIPRAEMLGELMHLKQSVAICGTHGKTTTTSLMAAMFDAAGLDPTVVNGGIINAYGTNARLGKGDWIVVEADESDGSFMKLPLTMAVVTNIDAEHMEHYGTFDVLKASFVKYIEKVPFFGAGILCIDHEVVRSLLPQLTDRRIITYGFAEDAHVRAINLRPSMQGFIYDVEFNFPSNFMNRKSWAQEGIKDIFLPMMGQHNVQNSLAAIAVAWDLGFGPDIIHQAFQNFKGVKRRFTLVGQSNGVEIIDDYAHHPVEIQTVLVAARQATSGRLIAVFQPHRYSRVNNLLQEFSHAFTQADAVIVTPIYSAGEPPLEGITKEKLSQLIARNSCPQVFQIEEPDQLAACIAPLVQPGDMIICLGAGTITYWAELLPEQLDVWYAQAGEAAA